MVKATPRPLYPRERDAVPVGYRRLGGPQGRSGRMAKISPPPEFDPRTFQPVACCYADIAISCHHINAKSVDTLAEFFLDCVNKKQICKQGMATRGLPRPDIRLEIMIHERKYKEIYKAVPVYTVKSYGGVEV